MMKLTQRLTKLALTFTANTFLDRMEAELMKVVWCVNRSWTRDIYFSPCGSLV